MIIVSVFAQFYEFCILISAGKSKPLRKRQNFKVHKTCFDRIFCHLQLFNAQSIRRKSANYASNNGMYNYVRIKIWTCFQ